MGGFDVVITGFKLNGRDTPARVLERVLGEPPDAAKALTRSFPAVVRRALSPVEADPLVLALRAAGARVELRPAGAPVEAAAPANQAPAAPTASAMAGLIASQPAPSAVPSPAEQGFKLGTLRIETPKAEKKATGKFILGTLKIMLKGPPAPPPPPPDYVITLAPVPSSADPEALLHATGLRDDTFDDMASQQPLELDSDALAQRSNMVSGGRQDAASRPSLMNLVRESLVDIPLRVVRRSRATEQSTELARGRVPYLWQGFVGVGIVLIVCLSWAVARKGEGEVAAAQDGAPLPGAAAGPAVTTQLVDEDAPKLHPILQLAPRPMEPALASILRKQVAGTHPVRIDWGEQGPPEDDRVSCVVVSGSPVQQEERVRALLATGRRYPTTSSLDAQMRDHMEVLRLADNDPKAKYTPLCLAN